MECNNNKKIIILHTNIKFARFSFYNTSTKITINTKRNDHLSKYHHLNHFILEHALDSTSLSSPMCSMAKKCWYTFPDCNSLLYLTSSYNKEYMSLYISFDLI